jgi:transcriptional regulator with XRE-family HTH domain
MKPDQPPNAHVKILRAHMGLTQEDLARMLNVSVHTVWRLEHANHKPQPLLQERLDKLLKKTFPSP